MKKHNPLKGFNIVVFFSCLAILFFTPISDPCFAQTQSKTTEYNALIQQADKALAVKDYPTALLLYSKAGLARPELKYASEKITEINTELDAVPDLRAQLFESIIIQAEDFFKQKDYPKAKLEYQKAIAVEPSAQFPKDRLAAISAVYSDPSDIAYFNDAVAAGDKAAAAFDFDNAILYYESALAVTPGSKAAKDKITAAKKQQTELKIKTEQSAKIIAAADKLLQAGKRTEARSDYQKALDLTPGNKYAAEKIKEIDNYQNEKKSIQDVYDKSIELADQFYINRDFVNARLKYQEALKAKPEARYPKEMLEKTKTGESQLQSDQQKYDAAIASAESLITSGDYDAALIGFRSALAIKPAETYPKTKITEIEKLIAENTSRKEAYDIAVKNGDQALSEKKFDPALAHYRNALTLLPQEKYPAQKIEEINNTVAQQKAIEDNYKKYLAEADKLFLQNKYTESIAEYTKALSLKPDEAYPQQKITEAQNQMALVKNKDESYAAAIVAGDNALLEKKYDDALTAYKQATSIKPSEKYPKDKSEEINKLLAKLKTDSDRYTTAIASGDKALSALNYTLALTSYTDALSIKPNEQYPQEKIAEIKSAQATQQAINEKYDAAIKSGDQLFADKNYDQALMAYNTASELKKSEKYPIEQIGKINKIVSDVRSTDENYAQAINEGDNNFNDLKYTEAIASYTKATKIKPAEAYPKSQTEKINAIIATQKKLDTDYQASIASADKLFAAQKYNEAIAGYEVALGIKPNEKYPAEKISESEKIISDLKTLQESYDKAVADGDRMLTDLDYANALTSYKSANTLKPAEVYPKQKISEIQIILDKDKADGQRYEEAIAQADKLFNAQNFAGAIEPYQRASQIKPTEKYPQEQIAKANQQLTELKKLEEDYQKLITEAGTLFKAADYTSARNLYSNAGTLKPAEKLPKEKVAEIDGILADLQNKEQNYTKHISEGDASFAIEKYTEALASYSSALKIKPTESYPKTQVEKINTLVAAQKKLDADYQASIASADKLFGTQNYNEAIAGYRTALGLKPNEKYPAEKISESEKIISDLKTLQESYDKAVADGDKMLTDKDYANALTSYKSANMLKPAEVYPKQKITEIQGILDKDKADGQRYQENIAQADKLFSEKKYETALEPYRQASVIKPSEKYPQDQITLINQLVAEQKKLEADYQKLITDGDALLKASKYDESKELFTNALAIKTQEKLPKDKIAEIDGILAGIRQKEENYSAAVKNGDTFFAEKKYPEAITSYNSALALKPTESYPKSQVEKINGLLAEQKKLDDSYLTALTNADKLFEDKKYPEAIAGFKNALLLKPQEKYPSEKITEAEAKIAELKALQEAYDKAIAEGDKKFAEKEYENALTEFKTANTAKPAETYPPKKIAEIQVLLDKIKADNEKYQEAIALADKFFTEKKYLEALEPYQRALTMKPGEKYPQDQIADINSLLAEQKKLDTDYQNLITEAESKLTGGKLEESRGLFVNAEALKPAEKLPKEKITQIDKAIAELKLKEENYSRLVNTAGELYSAKKLQESVLAYEEALKVKPLEKFPQDRIASIKTEIKAIDDSYNKAITLGDSKLLAKDLMEALNAYQHALEIKPTEEYPKTKIAEINSSLAAQKEEQEKLYASYIAEGEQLASNKDYAGAKSAYTKATGIKPSEAYPKQKIIEIDKIVEEIMLARRAEYNKALGEADKLYNSKIFDQAIEAYETAGKINPSDSYPEQQIAKIRKYLADHAIQDLFSQTLIISEGTEKKFNFSALEPRLRKNNYILLKARSKGKASPKVFLNYGKDNQKNGGIVLRSLDKTEISDYLIRISIQDKWYREDNNWISLFVESGEIEITRVQIAAGDE